MHLTGDQPEIRFPEAPITSYEPLNEPLPARADGDVRTRSARSSVALILGATVVSGLSGYVVTWRVFTASGAAGYAVFSVFWSALFLVVGVLFGVQQEATRAVAQSDPAAERGERGGRRSSLWLFAAVLAVLVAVAVLLTALLWAVPALGREQAGLSIFVAVGAGLNCLVAAGSGVMAGSGMWRQLAGVVALDGILRVAFVLLALALTTQSWVLALAVILPFPLALGAVILTAPRALLRRALVPERMRTLASNTLRTMIAASATAVLINGFPLILSFFANPSGHRELGSLVLGVTLTRAPILVPLMALSSFLVSQFARMPQGASRLALRLSALIAAVVAVLCLCAWAFGVPVVVAVFGGQFDLDAGTLTALVASSGMIGVLCVTGAAVLARNLHGGYAIGWVAASVVTISLLFVPLPLQARAALALAAGPAVGIAVHLWWLRSRSTRSAGVLTESAPG
jgi:O-antigen/teichoic acid export membrane protein